jgi:hypothetical protein
MCEHELGRISANSQSAIVNAKHSAVADILTEKVFGLTTKLVGASLRGDIKRAFVGALDAKTHLAELLDRLAGERRLRLQGMAFLRRCWSLSGKQAQK